MIVLFAVSLVHIDIAFSCDVRETSSTSHDVNLKVRSRRDHDGLTHICKSTSTSLESYGTV